MDMNRSLSRRTARRPSHVSLEIQELVLVDVPVADRQTLQQAVAVELTRLLQTQGLPQSLSQTSDRAVIQSDITINAGDRPTGQLGLAIAEAIYRELSG